ncbi:MAG TPA: glycosyltransferase family 4 protein [Caulobacteraceae bacterium]|nr:glycosyltransferase family 4 protein [Caulobacteraceae bacterium]
MTRVLVFSTLFPNAAQPNHGVFVENRLRETVALGGLSATVLAPVPFFPITHRAFGRYALFARVPRAEVRHGIEVLHPRYPALPMLGSWLAPTALFRAGLDAVRRLQSRGRSFNVIDAHYFYPDGVAAARLGQALRIPVVITGRGTDLTLIPSSAGPRRAIRWAAREASVGVAVCEDLRRRLVELGAPAERTLVLRNGVDLEVFRPGDRQGARASLGCDGFTLVSVGSLIERKGHHLVIETLCKQAGWRLLIAGSGPLRGDLEALSRRLKVPDRVRFLGEVPHRSLPTLYTAADVMVLASSREGWANVLLEAMACGTPVAATDVNGTREVVATPAAGRLIAERSAAAIAQAVRSIEASPPRRSETRRYAEQFGWDEIAQANRALLTAAGAAGYDGRHDPRIVIAASQVLTRPKGETIDDLQIRRVVETHRLGLPLQG